ncbi:Sensor protein [Stigmatella aurantiaca DW4/3-1]|uniref:histidine kinase n=4 Tax=Stigmatella aurantiaca TaxID=41 RepID=Q08MA3_STIAD|nr:Sensor protein [Stigmatella aurantiaca DW4/3-1]EAU61611.1 two-component sensor histidine kinase [Stigmatella aurantiaca DW4/3-1]
MRLKLFFGAAVFVQSPMDPSVSAEFLRQRDSIIEDWFRRVSERPVARSLPRKSILNNIPGLVDQIIEALSKAGGRRSSLSIPRQIAEEHGASRLDLGYGLMELGEEYNSLRDAFLSVLDSAGIALNNATASALHGAIDQAHRAGVEHYIQLREARLRERQSDFLARLVHDFRSPLSTVLTSVELIRREDSLSKGLSRNLDRIERATRRLLLLVEGQLATEAALAGNLQFQVVEVNLSEVAEDVHAILQTRAEEKGILLREDIPAGLQLRTDRLLLGQVLQNLVDNAIKYTPTGTVGVQAREAGGDVCITVEDTGRGIAPDLLPVIFDMYKRSEHVSPGRGVGLAVVKTIVSFLGGTIKAESELGKGSRFIVSLPRAYAARS